MLNTLNYEQAIVANDLKPTFDELESSIGDLNNALSKCDLIKAKVYPLPRTTKEEEDIVPDYIECDPVYGEEAFRIAKAAYVDFDTKPLMSTRFVYRCPGAIELKCDEEDAKTIEFMMERINWLKKQFDTLVQSLNDRDLQWEVVHSCLPGVITTQITRRFYMSQCGLKSVGFTWGINSSSERFTKEEAYAFVKKARKYKRDVEGQLSWDELIDRDLNRISGLPSSTQLSKRRVLRPAPMINVRDMDGYNKRLDGSLPIIVINQTERFKINNLKAYDKVSRDKRPKRSDKKIADTPFIEFFDFYLVKA
jgi:DNA replication terminus site-binding protein